MCEVAYQYIYYYHINLFKFINFLSYKNIFSSSKVIFYNYPYIDMRLRQMTKWMDVRVGRRKEFHDGKWGYRS